MNKRFVILGGAVIVFILILGAIVYFSGWLYSSDSGGVVGKKKATTCTRGASQCSGKEVGSPCVKARSSDGTVYYGTCQGNKAIAGFCRCG
jgi:hypothetical protein